jgi:hypothetical protein
LQASAGTTFAPCVTSACADYPSYLVDGKEVPQATLSGGGQVLSLAPVAPIAASARVSISLAEVTNPPTPGPKTLMVWTSSDPRPVTVRYSVVAPAPLSRATLRISDRSPGATATYSLALRTSGNGALEAGIGAGTAAGPSGPGTISLVAAPGTVFPDCFASDCSQPYSFSGRAGVAAGQVSAGGAAVSVVVPADIGPDGVITLSVPGVVNAPKAGPEVLSVWTSSDHLSGRLPYELEAAGKPVPLAPKLKPAQKHNLKPRPKPSQAKPSVFTVLPTPGAAFRSVGHGHAAFALVLLDDFLGSLFVSGLVGSVISLLPLRFLPGGGGGGGGGPTWPPGTEGLGPLCSGWLCSACSKPCCARCLIRMWATPRSSPLSSFWSCSGVARWPSGNTSPAAKPKRGRTPTPAPVPAPTTPRHRHRRG